MAAVLLADVVEGKLTTDHVAKSLTAVNSLVLVAGTGGDAVGKGGNAPVEKVFASFDGGMSAWVEDKVGSSGRPEPTSAGIVVSGGRGVGSQADFALIETL